MNFELLLEQRQEQDTFPLRLANARCNLQHVPLHSIHRGDYLTADDVELLQSRGSESIYLSRVLNLVPSIYYNRARPAPHVISHKGTFRVIAGGEIVSAYDYAGKTHFPVIIVEPGSSFIH